MKLVFIFLFISFSLASTETDQEEIIEEETRYFEEELLKYGERKRPLKGGDFFSNITFFANMAGFGIGGIISAAAIVAVHSVCCLCLVDDKCGKLFQKSTF